MYGATIASTMMLDERPPRSGLSVDLDTGPGSGLAGLRRLIRALSDAGAQFGDLPERHRVEWGWLTDPSSGNGRALADLALSASERRLHRESEQTFRVLAVGAAAVCHGAESLSTPVILRGLGRTDLPSLRGLVRAAEYGGATGIGRLCVSPSEAVEIVPATDPAADTRQERARCLQAMGVQVQAEDLRPVPAADPATSVGPGGVPGGGPDGALLALAVDPAGAPVDRIRAALDYSRAAFYASNWEGLALVALACLPVAAALEPGDVETLAAAPRDDEQAIEFEPALLRHPDDITAFLWKLLGVQASFRGLHTEALRYFRAMRGGDGPVSPETRAQSHLYAALTLAKRQHRLDEAVAELDAGFDVVARRAGEPATVSRERGWLHNLRGLTLFRQGDYLGALEQEKSALGCIEGAFDASAVHLRVNLVSNISVLQESAGKLDQALATWDRFKTAGAGADAKFVKHHAYRSGGLRIAAGDVDGGAAQLAESLQYCTEGADDFHEYEIAAELGTLLLGRRDRAAAGEYYEQAARAATRLGDPYRMAVAAVGRAVVAEAPVGEHTVALARAARTRTAQVEDLVAGCQDGGQVLALLPTPKTKLNRPFDLVNV